MRTHARVTSHLPPAVFVLSFAIFAAYIGSGMVSVVRVLSYKPLPGRREWLKEYS